MSGYSDGDVARLKKKGTRNRKISLESYASWIYNRKPSLASSESDVLTILLVLFKGLDLFEDDNFPANAEHYHRHASQ